LVDGQEPIMRLRVHAGAPRVLAPCGASRYGDGVKIGEVAVCAACLRTQLGRAELAAKRCACGGRIIVMPRGEVEKRRADRR
jgi:DNA-directed RNA polymerase subunit RPC12/RpoP